MFDPKIKVSRTLLEKLREAASAIGCTLEEFAEKALEKEADRVLSKTGKQQASASEVEEITKKLQGLGYLE